MSVPIGMSKKDFECQNAIFSRSSNVKIEFLMSKCDILAPFECQSAKFGPNLNVQIEF